MSLKAFHLVFISVAVLLCIGFGIWCVHNGVYVPLGIGAFVGAAGLVIYEIIFLRGTKTP